MFTAEYLFNLTRLVKLITLELKLNVLIRRIKYIKNLVSRVKKKAY
jgi:hypothetical protein